MLASLSEGIFEASSYRVDFYEAKPETDRLAFTFTEYGNRNILYHGFGTSFLTKNGINVVAIKTSEDKWYHNVPDELFQKIAEFRGRHGHRFGATFSYGSSMGGYAALLFAHRLGVDRALSISPQFDIFGKGENRWAKERPNFETFKTMQNTDVHPGCRYTIIYDPKDGDNWHYARFAEVIPPDQLEQIRVPHGGHPVGSFLNSAGLLKPIVLAIAAGETPNLAIAPALKAARHLFPKYYFTIATACLRHRKPKWARAIIQKAIDFVPLNPDYKLVAAQAADQDGDVMGALTHAATAVALRPTHPHMLAFLAGALHKAGLQREALHFIDEAVKLRPNHPTLEAQRQKILK